MDTPVVISSQFLNPLLLAPAAASVAQNRALASAVPANGALPAVFTRSLQALGALTGAGEALSDSAFLSALQANAAVSPLPTALGAADARPGLSAQSAATTPPLLLQALSAEDAANGAGEIPFLAPYQLGLQAAMALAPPPDQPVAAQPAATPAQASALQTPDPLEIPAKAADPTTSSLFQSHSGAMASNPLAALPSSGAGLAEAPSALRVMETYSGAATSAFSEGQPLNSNLFALNAAALGRPSSLPSTGPEILVPAYSPQGVPIMNVNRVGTQLDLTG